MESSGVPGAVQLSAVAWDALRLPADADDGAQLPPAQKRDIKGKGAMLTRTVHAGTPAAARLRHLLEAPWPTTAEGTAAVTGSSSAGKPPRTPAPRVD